MLKHLAPDLIFKLHYYLLTVADSGTLLWTQHVSDIVLALNIENLNSKVHVFKALVSHHLQPLTFPLIEPHS